MKPETAITSSSTSAWSVCFLTFSLSQFSIPFAVQASAIETRSPNMSGSCRVAAGKAHLPVGYLFLSIPSPGLFKDEALKTSFALSLFLRRMALRSIPLNLSDLSAATICPLRERVPPSPRRTGKNVCERLFKNVPLLNPPTFWKSKSAQWPVNLNPRDQIVNINYEK